MSKLGTWLENIGFNYPYHDKPGYDFYDVHGKPAKVDVDKQIMLVTYIPKRSDEFFKTEADAVAAAPKSTSSVWQIINAISGDILREPDKITGTSSLDMRHRHSWYMNSSGNGKMHNVYGHIHTIKNFKVSVDSEHDHELYSKKFKKIGKKLRS